MDTATPLNITSAHEAFTRSKYIRDVLNSDQANQVFLEIGKASAAGKFQTPFPADIPEELKHLLIGVLGLGFRKLIVDCNDGKPPQEFLSWRHADTPGLFDSNSFRQFP